MWGAHTACCLTHMRVQTSMQNFLAPNTSGHLCSSDRRTGRAPAALPACALCLGLQVALAADPLSAAHLRLGLQRPLLLIHLLPPLPPRHRPRCCRGAGCWRPHQLLPRRLLLHCCVAAAAPWTAAQPEPAGGTAPLGPPSGPRAPAHVWFTGCRGRSRCRQARLQLPLPSGPCLHHKAPCGEACRVTLTLPTCCASATRACHSALLLSLR